MGAGVLTGEEFQRFYDRIKMGLSKQEAQEEARLNAERRGIWQRVKQLFFRQHRPPETRPNYTLPPMATIPASLRGEIEPFFSKAGEYSPDVSRVLDLVFNRKRGSAALFGHFEFPWGAHSAVHLKSSRIFLEDGHSEEIASKILEQFSLSRLSEPKFSRVLGPSTSGGLLVPSFIKKYSGNDSATSAYAYVGRDMMPSEIALGYELKPWERVLIVDDIYHGDAPDNYSRVGRLIKMTLEARAEVSGIAVFAAQGEDALRELESIAQQFAVPVPVAAYTHFNPQSWRPENCPLCERRIPVTPAEYLYLVG